MAVPAHVDPVTTAVAVYVTLIGLLVEFVRVKAVIVPEPESGATPVIPMGCIVVHLRSVPAVVLLKVTTAVVPPEQMICEAGVKVTPGEGFTVILKDIAGPEQFLLPFVNVGVTVMTDVTGTLELFTALRLISPVPEVARPISTLSFAHTYEVVPAVLEVEKLIVFCSLSQTVTGAMVFTCAVGFTVIVKFLGLP